MKPKHLVILLLAVLVLGVAYLWTDQREGGGKNGGDAGEVRLLDNVVSEPVGRVALEQGAEHFELVLKDGLWRIPSRGGYPADGAKVRALFLKLFDLTVTQKLPTNPGAIGSLGLDDAAVKAGKGKVTLFAPDGHQLAVVRLGDARKGKSDSQPLGGMLTGQYVRRDDSNDVYLMPAPITLAFGLTSWIDANLVSVLPSAIVSISAFRTENGAEVPEFELIRTGELEKDTGFPVLTLKDGVPEGKSLQTVAVSQVRAALENVRMTDVYSADAVEVKDIAYDRTMRFRTASGLIYTVRSGQKGEKFYARLNVEFDEKLAADSKVEYDKNYPSPSPSPSATPKATPAPASPAGSPSPAPSPTPTPPPAPPASSTQDAAKLNGQFSPWVYELVSFQAQQLRKIQKDLVEPPAAPTPPAAASRPGAGMPPVAMMPHGMAPVGTVSSVPATTGAPASAVPASAAPASTSPARTAPAASAKGKKSK